MLVETYEVTETSAEGKVECDAAAIALIDSLGLEGQRELLRGDGETTQRVPYRKMTAEEFFVYRNLCSRTSELKKYSDGAIPLRVLQVAAHSCELFDRVEVWHPENADIKDPVLVGVNGPTYQPEYFILARWGEVLEPLEKLRTQAAEIVKARAVTKLEEIAEEVRSELALLATMTPAQMALKRWREPSYYGCKAN